MSDLHGEWAPSTAITLGTDEFGVFASYARAVHYPGYVFRANTTAWDKIAAKNIFNRHYKYFPGYEMPGTMAYVGWRLKF